ncbi:hypothetical protein ABEB22_01505 [Thioclava sp. 'Guangxiensis']|uniref:hypothetical protein n=1 Tax=Thioclava sp. 'Guangxiensis' TaxID=3149044 RepID=UPI003877D67B
MVGANKILTVSYGTFSCTLEGFDEPFQTMQAIAEYFRDLAAEDRYFGAEPPQPDAEMLHRIAEREIQRRVEAKIQKNGVILRASDETPKLDLTSKIAAPVAASVAEPVSEPAKDARPQSAAPAPTDDSVAAKLARIREVVARSKAEATKPAPTPEFLEDLSGAPEAQNFGGNGGFGEALDISGPVSDDELKAMAESDEVSPDVLAAEAEVKAAAEDAARQAELAAEEEAERKAKEEAERAEAEAKAAAEDAARQAELAAKEEAERKAKKEAERAQAEAKAAAEEAARQAERAAEEEAEHKAKQEAERAEAEAKAAAEDAARQAERAAEEEAERKAKQEAEQAAENEALSAELAALEETAEDAEHSSEIAQAESPEEASEAVPRPVRPALRARVIKVRRVQPTVEAPVAERPVVPTNDLPGADLSPEDEEDLLKALAELDIDEPASVGQAEAQVEIAPERDADESDAAIADLLAADEPETQEPIAEEPAREAAEPDAEEAVESPKAEPAPEVGTMKPSAADPAAPVAPRRGPSLTDILRRRRTEEPVRTDAPAKDAASAAEPAQAEVTPPEPAKKATSEADVSRLMKEADNQLAGRDNRRRLSAIAHLKAAVAATVAERRLKGEKAEPDETKAYREDLDRAVRPRRPVAGEERDSRPELTSPAQPKEDASRDAPLVLVSEQRVDKDISAAIIEEAVRPRRVTTSEIAQQIDEAAEEIEEMHTAAATSFAEFAEQAGTRGLADLLEAAAAYTAQIEQQPHFTAPQIMRKVTALEEGAGYSREDRMRSFGKLLRQGKINKINRGQYVVSEQSRFFEEKSA